MTEMHSPARALFLIDAPVERVKAVLARRPELRAIVHNAWVRLFVRDPFSPEGKGESVRMIEAKRTVVWDMLIERARRFRLCVYLTDA